MKGKEIFISIIGLSLSCHCSYADQNVKLQEPPSDAIISSLKVVKENKDECGPDKDTILQATTYDSDKLTEDQLYVWSYNKGVRDAIKYYPWGTKKWDGLSLADPVDNGFRLCLGSSAYILPFGLEPEDFETGKGGLFLWHKKEPIMHYYIYVLKIDWYIHYYETYDQLGPVGSGYLTQPTEPSASGKLPDFITSKVTMGNKDGNHEKYTWKINETAYVHDYIDNIGTADWEGKAKKIKVPFYLSKGTKEDSHSEWVRVSRQEIKKEHLKVKDKPKHEYIKFNLAEWANDSTVLPGRTYNFVVCADRPKDENNGDGDVKEKHKSNNCSTEAVFFVDFGPPRNVDLMADNLALTGGRTSLQAGEKYGLQVEVSNIGTEQPWNGFRTKYEIKGPGTGGVWQKIGDEHSKASSLYAGAIHFESMTGDDEVSAPTVGGDYVFRACADYEQVVPETDESNNCSAELPVTVIAPPPPAACVILNPLASLPATGSFDLAATSIEFPDVIQQGDEMHPKAQVCGVSGTSPRTRATWAYANCDGTGFTAFDGDTDDGLSAGECVTEENKEGDDLANMPPGRYVMYFIANGVTQVPESDHSNNVQAKEFVVE